MNTFLKVESKYNENLADFQVVVVTLLSNNNRTWDFIVDTDAYHNLCLNEDYLVTTQDDWLGTIVGIRFETVANAINLKATVLKPVPVYDDQIEVLDETEDECIEEDEMCEKDIGLHRYLVANMDDNSLKLKSQSLDEAVDTYSNIIDNNAHFPLRNPYDDMLDEADVEYQWLMADKAAPLKAVHYLWEYKYNSIGSRVMDLQNSINDLLVLKRFAEDKLVELRVLKAKGVDTYSKVYDNNAHFPLRNPYDNMLRVVLYKGRKEKNEK